MVKKQTETVVKLTKISLIVGILLAVPPLTVYAAGGFDFFNKHFDLVTANTSYITTAKFVVLDKKRESLKRRGRKLSHKDWVDWCNYGKQLGYWKVCPGK